MEEKNLTMEEINEMELTSDVADSYEEIEHSGGGLGKIVAVGLAIVGLGVAGAKLGKKKIKPWLIERKAESLRKEGFVVCRADECEVREIEVDYDEETEVVEETETTE